MLIMASSRPPTSSSALTTSVPLLVFNGDEEIRRLVATINELPHVRRLPFFDRFFDRFEDNAARCGRRAPWCE